MPWRYILTRLLAFFSSKSRWALGRREYISIAMTGMHSTIVYFESLTLHLPSYSEQLAKCLHSKAGSIQLKHGGQSLSPSPIFCKYHGGGDCLALEWKGWGNRSVWYLEKSKSPKLSSCPAATVTRVRAAARPSSLDHSRILEANKKAEGPNSFEPSFCWW